MASAKSADSMPKSGGGKGSGMMSPVSGNSNMPAGTKKSAMSGKRSATSTRR